jgi:hypothetical protein
MKKAISIFIVAGAMCGTLSGMAYAGTNSPVVDQRQVNQERRIEQGVASGSLTAGEAARLEAQQARIANREAAMKADGSLTATERAKLTCQQNRASRNIYMKKHNRRIAN